MIRTLILDSLIFIYTVVLASAAMIMSFLDPTGKTSDFIVFLWAWLILRTAGVRVSVEGIEKLRPGSPRIYMANHRSHTDVWAILSSIPLSLKFIAKKELFWIPFVGQAIYMLGHIMIDRSNRVRAFRSLDRAAEKIRKGRSVLIFPEGTRAEEEKLNEFKKGGFVLAVKSKVPIVPIGIRGSLKILPKGSYSIKPGVIEIRIGDEIETSGYTMENKEMLIEKVRKAMEDLTGPGFA